MKVLMLTQKKERTASNETAQSTDLKAGSKTKPQKDIEILDLKECADLLRVSTRTVQNYMKLRLPYVQVCKRGRLTFDREKVIRWWQRYSHPYEKLIRRMR